MAITPWVSCLMVTRVGREEHARAAIAMWRAQTYAHRELVIVADNAHLFREEPYICVLSAATNRSIGVLRQQSVDAASGGIIAIWDDDDIHHPRRLEEQIRRLGEADVSMLGRVVLTCVCKYTAISKWHGWEPTMVAARSVLPAYEDVRVGEDTAMVRELWKRRAAIDLLDAPELYGYQYHGKNACAADHWQGLFSAVSTHDPWRCAAQLKLVKPEADATLDEIKDRIARAWDNMALARCARALQFYFDNHPNATNVEKAGAAVAVVMRATTLTRQHPLSDPSR